MSEIEGSAKQDAAGPAVPASDDTVGRHATIPPRRGIRRRLFGVVLLLLIAGALGSGVWRHYVQARQVTDTAEQWRNFVPNVRVHPVRASDETVLVRLPGTTLPFQTANIFARASGYIEKRSVDIGSRVKAGDLLAEITAPELDHQIALSEANLQQTQAALGQAQANRELARVTSTRTAKLTADGWVSKEQGDMDRLALTAQSQAVQVAEANIAAQHAQLQVLHQQKTYQQVVAPFDGVITQRNIDIGSLVQADNTNATSMFTLTDSSVIRVRVYVPQDSAFGVSPGDAAVVRVPELPDRGFPGKVTRLADALDPTTRTLLTEIDVPNPDGALTAGVYCTVELNIPRKAPSLIIPADAVVFDGDGLHVAVVENGAAHFRKIVIVRDLGTEVEVRDGVKPGDQVIRNPAVDLTDGGKVQVTADATMGAAS